MKRLNVFCEGQTEQGFCSQVLQPHLFPNGDGIVLTLAVGAKDNHHIYGLGRNGYRNIKKFILNTIKQRAGLNVYFTSLFDLYALPNDFPGKSVHVRDPSNPVPYVSALETALAEDVNSRLFLPYIQLHEYETLLFADPDAFAVSFENCREAIQQLKSIVGSVSSIECINDGRETAPSKRIISVIPAYRGRKASAGPDIAEYIGLSTIRMACPHFDAWISQLESLTWS